MQVKKILESDVIAKMMAVYPESPMVDGHVDLEKIKRAMDVANIFGSLQMKILADLSPIEFMYLIETNHKIQYSPQGWIIPLHFVEVAYNTPDIMIAAIYEGENVDDVFQDPGIMTMIGNSISRDAQQRFLDNGHISQWRPTPNPALEGWEMINIEFDTCHETIAPINPVTKYQIDTQNRFEKKLREFVGGYHGDDDYEVKFTATYSKYVNIHELFNIVTFGKATITNLSYGIHQLIRDGYIPQDLYTKTTVNNVLGNPQERISGNIEAIEELMGVDKCLFAVVLTSSITYHINDEYGIVRTNLNQTNFDRYLHSVMDDNIRELVPDFKWNDQRGQSANPEIPVPDNDPVEDQIEVPVEEHVEVQAPVFEEDIPEQISATDEPEDMQIEESPAVEDDDDFSLLGDVDKAFDSMTEAVESIATPAEEPTAAEDVGTFLGTLAFLITNGNFNSIKMVEENEEYHKEGIRGVVCADYGDDKMPGVYYLGRPVFTEGAPTTFKWDILSLDKLFGSATAGYFNVVHWYNPDGTITENVGWTGTQQPQEVKK